MKMVEQRVVAAKVRRNDGVIETPDMEKIFSAGWTIKQIAALPLNETFNHLYLLLERDGPPAAS
jgi:hypothetical protein